MGENKDGWGAVLRGEDSDIQDWVRVLTDKFDPWIEVHGNDTVLRSSSLSDLETAEDVRLRALDLIDCLNGAVALSQQAEPVSFDGVVRFESGRVHRTIFAQCAEFGRAKAGAISVVISDANGNVISQPPRPSEVQEWATIAEEDDLIEEALIYFGRSPTWFNIYKALECLELRFGGGEAKFLALGWAPKTEIERLKRSAQAFRHATSKFKPSHNPMSLNEAKDLVSKLLRRALIEAKAV